MHSHSVTHLKYAYQIGNNEVWKRDMQTDYWE